MNYKVIDNFMDQEYFYPLQAIMFDQSIPWFFRDRQVYHDKNSKAYFSHNFYIEGKPVSSLYNNLIPTLKSLDAKALVEIRANLLLKEDKPYYCAWHCDRPFRCKTAIYYLNNNNGATYLQIKDKEIKIESKENRMLVFDSEIKHRVLSQTDVKERIVINYNYYE